MFNHHSLRQPRFASALALLFVLALLCLDAHAELVFRSVEHVDGQQRW